MALNTKDTTSNINSLDGVRYSIFYGPNFAFQNTMLHRKVYYEWQRFWTEHFQEVDKEAKLYSDELSRTKFITVLHKDNTPIAMLLCSPWNLQNGVHLSSRYLQQYPIEGLEHLFSLQLRQILSLEYFFIHPDWRFQRNQLPISEVIIGLALKLFTDNPQIDGAIGIARRLVKSQNRTASWGMREIFAMNVHNNECSMVFCTRKDYQENPDPLTRQLRDYFWEHQERIDFSIEELHPQEHKKAA